MVGDIAQGEHGKGSLPFMLGGVSGDESDLHTAVG